MADIFNLSYNNFNWTFWLLFGLTLVLLNIWTKRRKTKDPNEDRLPPGTFGLPLLGETLTFLFDGTKYMEERLNKYGPVFKTSLLGKPTVVISGPQYVRQVLQGEGITMETNLPHSARVLMGNGALSTSTGTTHRAIHRTIKYSFNYRNLRDLAPHIDEIVRRFITRWQTCGLVASGVLQCRILSFEVASKILLGIDLDDNQIRSVMKLFDLFNEAFFSFPVNLPGFAYYKGMHAKKQMTDLIDASLMDIVDGSDHFGKYSRFKPSTLLRDVVTRFQGLQESSPVSEQEGNGHESPPGGRKSVPEEVKNVALELMFGSHETVASACCAILITLADRRDVIDKIYQELKDAHLLTNEKNIGNNHEGDLLTFEDVNSLSYVRCVMNEVLRLRPPLAGAFRKTLQPLEIKGYHIPKDWSVLYTIPTTHNLSPVFSDDTNEFKPERWETIRQAAKSGTDCQGQMQGEGHGNDQTPLIQKQDERFQYIPFGGGSRACVGKEFAKLVMKIFIVELVRSGRWYLPNGDPKMKTAPIPFPKDGLPLQFEGYHHGTNTYCRG